MLFSDIDICATEGPRQLAQKYQAALIETIDVIGKNAILDATGLTEQAVSQLLSGDPTTTDLETAAAIVSLKETSPDHTTIVTETRHDLMLEMSTAVTNIDVLAGELESDVTPNEIQAKLEGRLPLSIAEYAAIKYNFAKRNDR